MSMPTSSMRGDRERIELALAHAGRADIDRAARTSAGTAPPPSASAPNSARRRTAPPAVSCCARAAIDDQPFQCSTQISVNRRRAVSKSTSTLRLSRSMQDARAFVVQAAPAHVDRLDLVGRRGADRRVIAVADHEVVLHDALNGVSESRCAITGLPSSRRMSNTSRLSVDAEMQRVRPAVVADRRERIVLEQIVDRDRALVLDVGTGAADRSLVERHRDEPVAGRLALACVIAG